MELKIVSCALFTIDGISQHEITSLYGHRFGGSFVNLRNTLSKTWPKSVTISPIVSEFSPLY